jgi:lipoyl synthase
MSSKRRSHRPDETGTILRTEDRALFREAWRLTRKYHGDTLDVYLPGMIRYGDLRGRYPAVSITGDRCRLLCDHCRGRLLEPMIKAQNPDDLYRRCRNFAGNGAQGVLLTGGSDLDGRLPWERFLPTIERISADTNLFLSAHTGFPDSPTCRDLKSAGVQQGLMDVMGDDETATRIYHLKGLETVLKSLSAIKESGLQLAPHIVAGLYHGRIRAEMSALEIIRAHSPHVLVIVALTPLKGTPMAEASHPSPLEMAHLVARARLMMPEIPISLGCERPRNKEGWAMERLAIRAGINRMAVWSDQALLEARGRGLKIRFQRTCCSVDFREEYACSQACMDF